MDDVRLTPDAIHRLAELARLDIHHDEAHALRDELEQILAFARTLDQLPLDSLEPLVRPFEIINRLDDDEPRPPLPIDALLDIAPAVEDRFVAVPRVIDDGGDA
ncbi:MAG: Asp-tRNA(Asn)/Glu-tRNA(Gln) amidotransferase subunit GatC [Phycisphaerales bacterium]|nr:Asp-tRNA(Asn)/Glu-tRNA(Gln) amidotransferase subunit GatC [Phycisphaerales bacterium]